MALQDLPTELLRAISENGLDERDLSALSRTCVRFFHALVPDLYKLNHLHHLDHINNPRYNGPNTSAISWAIDKLNIPTIQRATKLGLDIVRIHHVTEVATLGNNDIFKLLWACNLEHGGFKVLIEDENGKEPLLSAVISGRKEIISTLLETGLVDTQVQALYTNKLMHIAAFTGQHETVKLLIDRGSSARTHLYSITPIMAAVAFPDTWAVTRHAWGKNLVKNPDGIADTVRVLLENGADAGFKEDAEITPYEEDTPLHLAAANNFCEAAEVLVAHGADINAQNRRTLKTPLHYATQQMGHLKIVQTLVKLGADPNAADYQGQTPLALTRDTREPIQVTRFLLGNGSRMIIDTNNNTPLHRLSTVGFLDFIDVLLEHGADINAQNNNGETPLRCICEAAGQHILMQHLIDRGASLAITDNLGISPLGAAATHYSQDTIKYLISKGSNPNTMTKNGLPLLQVAIGRESTQFVESLLELGADPTLPNRHGRCAINFAAMIGKIQMMEVLLNRGVSINAHDAKGLTPLMSAIEGVVYDSFDFLLKNGASVNDRDNSMQTPLHKAAKHGKVGAALTLLKLGADINAVDDQNQTPIDVASANHRHVMVEVLLEKGADETIRSVRTEGSS